MGLIQLGQLLTDVQAHLSLLTTGRVPSAQLAFSPSKCPPPNFIPRQGKGYFSPCSLQQDVSLLADYHSHPSDGSLWLACPRLRGQPSEK